MTTIAFIGLGTMGGPMATNLVKAGYRVQGHDVDAARLRAHQAIGGIACCTIAQACEAADIAITMLPKDAHVRSVLLGDDGVVKHLQPDRLVIEMSTISPDTTMEMARALNARGLRMLDAPVGRTPRDAEAGTLLMLVGGELADLEQVRPVLDAMGDKTIHLGPQGCGIRMKVANNYMSMVSMVLTAETLLMARQAGIQTEAAVEVLQNTAAGRGQINVNFPKKVLAGDLTPDFPLSLGDKDISLGLALGQSLGVPLFLGAAARQLFGLAPAFGRSDQDCTAMLHLLEDLVKGGERCA